jgi:polyisoprenoid-binding protein YceI
VWPPVRGHQNKRSDEHLRSADFFDVVNHPDITFTVDGTRPDNGGVRETGSLTVRGRTRPVPFDAKVFSADGEVTLDGELTDREFGTLGGRAAARRGSQG